LKENFKETKKKVGIFIEIKNIFNPYFYIRTFKGCKKIKNKKTNDYIIHRKRKHILILIYIIMEVQYMLNNFVNCNLPKIREQHSSRI